MAFNLSPNRATVVVTGYVAVAGLVTAATRSPFSAYVMLVIGVVMIAVLGESFRSIRLVDGLIESATPLFTRRIALSDISSVRLGADGWGTAVVLIRGPGRSGGISVPVARFSSSDVELDALLIELRRLADTGVDVDPAVLAL